MLPWEVSGGCRPGTSASGEGAVSLVLSGGPDVGFVCVRPPSSDVRGPIIVDKLVSAPCQRLLAPREVHVPTSCPPLDRLPGLSGVSSGAWERPRLSKAYFLFPVSSVRWPVLGKGFPGLF